MRQDGSHTSRHFGSSLSTLLLLGVTTLQHPAYARLARRDDTNYFVNPQFPGPSGDFTDNLSFTVGSVIDLGWVTDYTSVSLQLCQQYSDESAACFPLFRNQAAVTSVQWKVSLGSSGFFLSTSQVFYFMVDNGNTDSDESFTCHYFNIKESGGQTTQIVVTATVNPHAVAASSSSVAPLLQTLTMSPDYTIQAALASAAPTTLTTTSAASTTAGNKPTTSSTTKSSNSGLSQGATIGIGVGVGIGLLLGLIGALIGFCFWRRGKKRHAKEQERQQDPFLPVPYQDHRTGSPSEYSAHPKFVPMQEYGHHGGELPAEERAQELPGNRHSSTQELPGSQPYRTYR